MALQLTKEDIRLFSGTKNKEFLLDIFPPKASTALVAIRAVVYNGKPVAGPPYKVKLEPGTNGLVVVYFCSEEGIRVFLKEVDTADASNTQALAQPTFDLSDPSVVVTLKVA